MDFFNSYIGVACKYVYAIAKGPLWKQRITLVGPTTRVIFTVFQVLMETTSGCADTQPWSPFVTMCKIV